MNSTLQNKFEKLKEKGFNLTVNQVIMDGFTAWKNIIFYGVFCVLFTYLFTSLINNLLGRYLGTNLIDLEFIKAINKLNNSQASNKIIPLVLNYLSNPLIILKSLLSAVVGILLYPLTAGIVYCAYQTDRNGKTSFKELISGYQGTKFLKLCLLALIVLILHCISFYLLFIPSLYFTPAFILAGAFIIIDDAPLIQAIIYSFRIVNKKFGKVFLLLVISCLISKVVGIFLCFVGIIFTYSFSQAMVYSLYKNTVGSIDVDDEINEN
ncbi:hypothetical protein [Apibacter mensalis]|uniref:hypothetical protein n=1 Tax=Apibacter mensalis TaxID=1586267 RepID=UPI0026EA9A20|nr:hypothetical protein [Apibacter mensalis]